MVELVPLFVAKWTGVRVYDSGKSLNYFKMRFDAFGDAL